MPKEKEHKFLFKAKHFSPEDELRISRWSPKEIVQGYLSTKPTVRVRLVNDSKAFLTIKGAGKFERDEFEYPIPLDHAREMLAMCGKQVVEKVRYELDGWEIDVFSGRHDGLVLLEYELAPGKRLPKKLPKWVGKEVTQDARYSNANLAINGLKKIKI